MYIKTRYPGILKYQGRKGEVYLIDFYADGKRHREVVGSNLGETRAKLEEIRQKGKRGEYQAMIDRKKKTFDELLDAYIEKVKDQDFFKNSLRCFVPIQRDHFKGKLLFEIDYKALEDYRDMRKNTPRKYKYKTRPRTERTVDIEMKFLGRMFKKALQWDWIEKNPFDKGEGLFYRKVGRRERALTPDEMTKLIDAASLRFKPILLTAILIGLRKSDILHLRWEDIDLERGRITLIEEKTGKTRIIPLGRDMTMLIQGLPVKGRYLFPGPKGEPLTDIKHPFELALRKAGIERGEGRQKIVFHSLRHSCISQLVERGADTTMVKNYVNHASAQMTEHYTHLSEEFQRRTGQLLDGLYDVSRIFGQKMGRNRAKDEIQSVAMA